MTDEYKAFVVWSGLSVNADVHFYTDDHVSLMTKDFSEARVFDTNFDFWHLLSNPKIGRFKVHHAPASAILKWKLQNEVPSDRL